MKKHFLIFLLLMIFLSSCGKASAPLLPTITPAPPTFSPTGIPTETHAQMNAVTVAPNCILPKPTQEDIDRALSYTGDVFSASAWDKNFEVTDSRVAVTWQDVGHGATAYLEALIFSCGYEEPDLNKYFNEENWQAIFANYESYQHVTECRNDKGLRLYQFKAQNQGLEYAINYWAQSDTSTRVIVTMLVFPTEEQTLLGDYSARLFPDLPNCS